MKGKLGKQPRATTYTVMICKLMGSGTAQVASHALGRYIQEGNTRGNRR